MKLSILIAIAPLLAHNCVAQGQPNASSVFLRRYVANVFLTGQRAIATGVLFDMTDSTLTLTDIEGLKPKLKKIMNQHGGTLPPIHSIKRVLPLYTYQFSQIYRLSVHRRGHAAKGFLMGLGFGAIAGFAAGDDPPGFLRVTAYEKAVAGSLIFSLTGLLIGGVMTKNSRAKKQSIAVEAGEHFQKFTIVDQLKQAALYAP